MVPGLSVLLFLLTTVQPVERQPMVPFFRADAYRFAEHCALETDPEPRDTPNPLLNAGDEIVVDFIIGWDGKIYSPFILESSSEKLNSRVLKVLSSWRYRPATCNHIPANVEGKVVFTTAE